MIPYRALAIATVLSAAVGLSGCQKRVEPPTDVGVCWVVETQKDKTLKFNRLADNQPRIENCAVELERVRLRFIGMGSPNRRIMGAFQGNFIWDGPEGVSFATELDAHPYPALQRGDDGRLIIPGAVPATPGPPAQPQ